MFLACFEAFPWVLGTSMASLFMFLARGNGGVQVKRRSLVMEDLGDEMLHQLSTAKAQEVKKADDVVPRRGVFDGFRVVFPCFSFKKRDS